MRMRGPILPLVPLLFLAAPASAQSARSATSAGTVVSATALDSAFARERANFRVVLEDAVRVNILAAAEAMPADKYGFAPTAGEFRGVRTFSHQLKHLAATNFILAAAALGEDPPPDAGDEEGPA